MDLLVGLDSPRPVKIIQSPHQPKPMRKIESRITCPRIGEYVFANDTSRHWYLSKVLDLKVEDVEDRTVRLAYIHYCGWRQKWDEWIDIDSDRLAKAFTKDQSDRGPGRILKEIFDEIQVDKFGETHFVLETEFYHGIVSVSCNHKEYEQEMRRSIEKVVYPDLTNLILNYTGISEHRKVYVVCVDKITIDNVQYTTHNKEFSVCIDEFKVLMDVDVYKRIAENLLRQCVGMIKNGSCLRKPSIHGKKPAMKSSTTECSCFVRDPCVCSDAATEEIISRSVSTDAEQEVLHAEKEDKVVITSVNDVGKMKLETAKKSIFSGSLVELHEMLSKLNL